MNIFQNIMGKRLINNGVMVEWVRHGEGEKGGNRADHPQQGEMLHFNVSRITQNGAEAVFGSSYCTQVPAATDETELQRLLEILMDQVYDPVRSSTSIKRICEDLSVIEPGYGQGV